MLKCETSIFQPYKGCGLMNRYNQILVPEQGCLEKYQDRMRDFRILYRNNRVAVPDLHHLDRMPSPRFESLYIQSWALSVLLNFFNNKTIFLHFYQVNLTGRVFLNRTGAVIGY